ncbi:MAG: Prophage regulatory protein (AlpA) [Acidimicrobiales bacterium]|nr:Prophage regulatory protein (AlpA) [Acidimicrobiales bacterium]
MERIDPNELLDASEVAAMLGLSSRTAISVYRSRYGTFPDPVIEKSRCVLWSRRDIQVWLDGRSRRSR